MNVFLNIERQKYAYIIHFVSFRIKLKINQLFSLTEKKNLVYNLSFLFLRIIKNKLLKILKILEKFNKFNNLNLFKKLKY